MAKIIIEGNHQFDDYGRVVWWPTRVSCECGRIIDCSSFSNRCHCGIIYDHNGEEILRRKE